MYVNVLQKMHCNAVVSHRFIIVSEKHSIVQTPLKNKDKAPQNGLKCAELAILKTISNRTKNINDAEKTASSA